VIGVRPFLIAYNLYLNTDNVEIAEKISRTIRFSNGGLRYVQAKGFLVEGQAQVSMNLTHFEKTPIHLVQEMVRREAARCGVAITRAELVGMIPQKALMESAKYYLQLDEMLDEQVLEYRLHEAPGRSGCNAPRNFLARRRLRPAHARRRFRGGPGGCFGRQPGANGGRAHHQPQKIRRDSGQSMTAVLAEANTLREQLTAAISEDAAAFEAVDGRFPQQRSGGKPSARRGCSRPPSARPKCRCGSPGSAIGPPNWQANWLKVGNINAVTDATAGVLLALAAVETAALNVQINATTVKDKAVVKQLAGRTGHAHWGNGRTGATGQSRGRRAGRLCMSGSGSRRMKRTLMHTDTSTALSTSFRRFFYLRSSVFICVLLPTD
jgi:glutamate formiminotransferase/formiminotetrahydrofolate cyclodeaminase